MKKGESHLRFSLLINGHMLTEKEWENLVLKSITQLVINSINLIAAYKVKPTPITIIINLMINLIPLGVLDRTKKSKIP